MMRIKKPNNPIRDNRGRFKKGEMNGKRNLFYGKKHTSKTKKLMGERKKKLFELGRINQAGKSNYFYGKQHNIIWKKRHSEIMKKKYQEGYINPMKGHIPWNKGLQSIKQPNWQGGISFEPYGIEFNKELKEKIRKRDNHVCQECGKTQKELKRKLQIHHIDYNKQNNSSLNFISLCLKCHIKTNYNRTHWKRYFQMKILIKEIFNPENILIFNENKQLIGVKN